MTAHPASSDIVMLGTFSAWRLGTLQVRALPIAQELTARGLRVTIITTPWDEPVEAGVHDVIGGVRLINTATASLPQFPLSVREMVQRTRSIAPRLVHVFKPRGYGGIAGAALARDLPIVVDSDDWEGDGGWNRVGSYPPPVRRMFDWQERSLIRRARVVTAASTLLEVRARRLRPDHAPESVVRVPNGLASPWRHTLESASHENRTECRSQVVLVYSRFEEIASDWLGRFVEELQRSWPHPVQVLVVGPAEPLSWGVASLFVDLLGYVARDVLPSIIGSAALAVFPLNDSLVSRSKQSVKLLELMAGGCPVVASDVGDVASTLGNAGVVVTGSDPCAFAQSVRTLLANRVRLCQMSQCGVERVRSQFQIAAVADSVLAAYEHAGLNLAEC